MTTDGQARNAYPAWRIFIFGQEVTEDVRSCATTWADNNRAPNTAEFVLTSKFDRYILTETDIAALYSGISFTGEDAVLLPDVRAGLRKVEMFERWASQSSPNPADYTALAESQRNFWQVGAADAYRTATEKLIGHVDRVVRERVQAAITDPVKLRVVNAKIGHRQTVSQPDLTVTGTLKELTPSQFNALRGDAARYPYQQGDCIFHSNDPVRIFWRDPFNPAIWYHKFSGFVSDWVDSVSASNERLVTIRCEDVTRILRYARVTTQPGIFDIKKVSVKEDLTQRSFFEAGFANLTLAELMYLILWGPKALLHAAASLPALSGIDEDDLYIPHTHVSVRGTSISRRTREGAGGFSAARSLLFIYGPEAAPRAGATNARAESIGIAKNRLSLEDDLSLYQATIDHRVHPGDLEMLADVSTGAPDPRVVALTSSIPGLAEGRASPSDIITVIGENPHLFPVDGGRFVMLLPGSLGPGTNRNIVDKSLIQNIALFTTWRNRLSMIYDTLEKIEFSFYATPKGDLVVEFPLNDFSPDDFGETPFLFSPRDAYAGASEFRSDKFPVILATPPVAYVGPYGPGYTLAKHDTISYQRTFSDENIRTQFKTTWSLVQAYAAVGTAESIGIAPAILTIRSLIPLFGARVEGADPVTFIDTPEGAALYCAIKLNQQNANARTAAVNALPRLQFQPNRPILVSERNYIATLRSVTDTITWNSDMSANLSLNYVRGWDGSVENNKPRYTPLGGYASKPYNYKLMFGLEDPMESMKSSPRSDTTYEDASTTSSAPASPSRRIPPAR